MKFTETMKQFCVELTKEEFIKILDKEKEQENNNDWDNHLFNELNKIDGVDDTDYNGHFGANIFFSFDVDYDEAATMKAVKKVIEKWVK